MKRFLPFVIFSLLLFSLPCQNKFYYVQNGDQKVFCFQFESSLSFFLEPPFELQGCSDLGSSFLLPSIDKDLFILGKIPQTDFLKKSQIKKLNNIDKLKAYYIWERKFQEEEQGNIFKDDLQISEINSVPIGYYQFFPNKTVDQIKDTETVATEGVMFVFEDSIIYINKFILKQQDPQASKDLLFSLLNTLKITSTIFNQENALGLFNRLKTPFSNK